MSNKTTDDEGYSWQSHNEKSGTAQQNTKTWDGEHTWYDPNTLKSGWHGKDASDDVKSLGGKSK
ncbi:MAG: hypothetical protein IJI43_00375 [Bacilli bacterium]|nr:hypothetical protein [Bacilli bacterium]